MFKGEYEWALVDAGSAKNLSLEKDVWKKIDSGLVPVIQRGKQKNLITDKALLHIFGLDGSFPVGRPFNNGGYTGKIFLSDDTLTPGTDYRKTISGMGDLSVLVELTWTTTLTGPTSYVVEANFNPPSIGNPRTVEIIGINFESSLFSFIDLTTPITQQDTQFFFVRYTISAAYTGAGHNGVINSFVSARVNGGLLNPAILTNAKLKPTFFKAPSSLPLCGRPPAYFSTPFFTETGMPNLFAKKYDKDFGITEVPGPHGCPVVEVNNNGSPALHAAIVSIPDVPTTPTYGRVFTHALNDDSVFSNPSNPPLSKGGVEIPASVSTADKIFKKVAFKITQTGEANDTPDLNTGKFQIAQNIYSALDLKHINPLELNGSVLSDRNFDWDVAEDLSGSIVINRYDKLSWAAFVGEYLYFTQTFSGTQYICKWLFGTLESSVEVMSLSSNTALAIGTDIWIATSSGLVKLDTLTDTSETFTTGLLDLSLTDLAYDKNQNILWIGHATGLTKWDPVTEAAVSTHEISSPPFDILTANQIRVYKGQLSASHGFVCRGGRVQQANSSDVESPWVFDSNLNKLVSIPRTNFSNSVCTGVCLLGDGTGNIAVECGNSFTKTFEKWDVDPNLGTFSKTLTSPTFNLSSEGIRTVRISPTHISATFIEGSGSVFVNDIIHQYDWDLAANTVNAPSETLAVGNFIVSTGHNAYNNVCPIVIDGVVVIWFAGFLIPTSKMQILGWTGSEWSNESSGSMDIPDAPQVSLINELTIDFDNAVGFPSNQQFIEGENLMFVTGPGQIKDNLQTMTYKVYHYFADLIHVEERPVTVPSVGPYTHTITEAADLDFKGLETDESFIEVKHSITQVAFQWVSSNPSVSQYSVSEDGVFTFNADDAGTDLLLTFQVVERH